MTETYIQWLAKRQAIAKARIEAMSPITPPSTPLMDLLRRQTASVRNG